jgi:late competence protein required for DNA uptake (superfamily II DNA/RNA helicase)
MPAGQAHTIWFSELKDILKNKWSSNLSIKQHFDLVHELNEKLKQIRTELKIQPPMMWCSKCQKRHRSKFTDVSITAMYYSLERFDLCNNDEFKKLLREWKKYSKSENIDIYGNGKTDKNIEIKND